MSSAAQTDEYRFQLSGLQATVGAPAFARGRAYAQRGRVLSIAWDAGAAELSATVVGQGAFYKTSALFEGGLGAELVFVEGECSCPVGWNCKHVAALVIAASSRTAAAREIAALPPEADAAPAPNSREWERPLRALVEAPRSGASANPLALELGVDGKGTAGLGPPRLMARLMRAAARGGWANGSLRWNALDPWHLREQRADHVTLVRELLAMKRAGDAESYSYYGYADKLLDLSDCGARLWPLLDEAASIGLQLIHRRAELGELPPYLNGELAIDVTRSAGGGVARPVLHTDSDERLEPLLFLGASGHGLVCAADGHGVERAHRPLRLVRLARPTAPGLQRLLLDQTCVEIPAAELDRFAEDVCPELRAVAPVVSSDRSFTPPEISAPSLVLRARYGKRHTLELGWAWAYRVGAGTRRTPLEVVAGPGFRDVGAERAFLAGIVLSETGLGAYGLVDAAGRPSGGAGVVLRGLESLRFTTEELPRLGETVGFTIEVEGEPPQYRDVGDSLTIGVSTDAIDGERDWFDLGVTINVAGRELPLSDVFVALAAGEPRLLLDDGGHFSLLEPRLQSLRQLIEEARALAESPPGQLRISRYQAGFWAELVALGVVTAQADGWRRQVEALLELDGLTEHEPPPTLAAELRPYQRDGFRWLASLCDLELGGILADDMGLGKTVQALALISHLRFRTPVGDPFLVVAPTSVVSGWAGEARRFAPGLRVEAVTDTLAKSGRVAGELAAADVVITTYNLLRLDVAAYHSVAWAGVFLDEAQYVKNHQAKTYRCVRELAAPFKFALTGTPLENNLMELWSLLSITAPGLFPDPKRFAEQYARPIERGGDTERLARLRRRIKPLVKRRTKELVAPDLPAKQEQPLEVDLHPRHRKLYDTYLQRERQKILGLLGDFDRNRFTILRSITLLRQLSLHAGLVDSDAEGIPCAKLEMLVEHLTEIASGGHRALVFSQFTGFLAKVRERLDREGIGFCYLDGATRRRDRVLEKFREGDDPVFLISLKAGGFGLNLTEADYCFLLDPWWNPATEAQAIDRIHRIGQTRPVMVYRMISRDTIEEKVVALARRKAELFSGVMDDGDLFASSVTAEDIRGLLQ